jgi:biopolymer transport protein ExbD
MPLKTQTDELPTLNLTPMIDVVFLLIIFFMAASKFAEVEADLELQLPEVATASPMTSAPKQRTISVEEDGAVELDGEGVSLPELTAKLTAAQSEYPQLSVVIRGDAACAFQHVAAALAACKDAHIAELAITVKIAQGDNHVDRK